MVRVRVSSENEIAATGTWESSDNQRTSLPPYLRTIEPQNLNRQPRNDSTRLETHAKATSQLFFIFSPFDLILASSASSSSPACAVSFATAAEAERLVDFLPVVATGC